VIRERASVLRCTYVACLVIFRNDKTRILELGISFGLGKTTNVFISNLIIDAENAVV
jgi:hypothetical protein